MSCHPGVKPSWSWSQKQGEKAGVRLQRARFWSFKILYLYESCLFLWLGVCILETSKSKQQQKQREDRCLQEQGHAYRKWRCYHRPSTVRMGEWHVHQTHLVTLIFNNFLFTFFKFKKYIFNTVYAQALCYELRL